MHRTVVWTLFLVLFLDATTAQSTCKCSKIPTGQWEAAFAEVVVPGYQRTAKVAVKHLYSEVYYGAFLLPSVFPFTPRYRMDYLGYLNGTTCELRGSLANVLQRLTLVFKMKYDEAEEAMKGTYHRSTFFSDDDHFTDMSMKLKKPKLDNELKEAVNQSSEMQRMPIEMQVKV